MRIVILEVTSEIVDEECGEDCENDDLEAETSQGNVDAGLAATRADNREASTSGLKYEADEVEWDEDPIKEVRLEARDLGIECDYSTSSYSHSHQMRPSTDVHTS